jgi:FecR protein
MSDDYLWDKSGKPDPEIEKLERSLARLGHREAPLELPSEEKNETPGAVRIVSPRERPALPWDQPLFGLPARIWAVAATVLVLAGAVTLVVMARRPSGWAVARLEGAPRVGERRLAGTGRLAVGDWLETDASSRARLTVGAIGELMVEPGSRLRLLEAGDKSQRLHLALGTVTAIITAPPRQFVVETPSARAVDLGCAYTLEVDPSGAALVTVLAGWVSFEDRGREAFIPAGARCVTRPGIGPGTPYFTDAPDAFKNALALLDVAPDDSSRGAWLPGVLSGARREDAFTLWHLLARFTGAEREAIYTRLAELVPPPSGVTREGVLAGDRAMLDRWWDELGFGEMKWWRLWQRSWPAGPA